MDGKEAAVGQRLLSTAGAAFGSRPCGHSGLFFTGSDHRVVVVATTNGFQSSREVNVAGVDGRLYRTDSISATEYEAGREAAEGQRKESNVGVATDSWG